MTEIKYLATTAPEWLYPEAGDPPPPLGTKLWLLNDGGAATTGPWTTGSNFLAYALMLKRNKEKERIIRERRTNQGDAGTAAPTQCGHRPRLEESEEFVDPSYLG